MLEPRIPQDIFSFGIAHPINFQKRATTRAFFWVKKIYFRKGSEWAWDYL